MHGRIGLQRHNGEKTHHFTASTSEPEASNSRALGPSLYTLVIPLLCSGHQGVYTGLVCH